MSCHTNNQDRPVITPVRVEFGSCLVTPMHDV